MEDHFDTLLYLIVGVIYLVFNNAKSSNANKKTVIDTPSKHQQAPTAGTHWPDTWEGEAHKAPVVKNPLAPTDIKKVSPYPIHHTPPQPATQQPSGKKIDRVLRRYSSWKKAVIMAELIQPYT